METVGSIAAVYADHSAAEDAVKKLVAAGLEMKNLSVVGKGYHSEEKVVGFYNDAAKLVRIACLRPPGTDGEGRLPPLDRPARRARRRLLTTTTGRRAADHSSSV